MGTLCLLCVAKEVFDLTLQHQQQQQQQQQQHATVAQLLRGKREKEDEEEPLEDEAEFVLVDLQAMIKRASGLYGLQSVLAYFFSMNLK